jgi:hypothetical protein
LNSRDRNTPKAANYNSAVFSQTDQNILQGQVYCISVSEVNFPYDIPNIQKGIAWAGAPPNNLPGAEIGIYNSFILVNGAGPDLTIDITPGFYTGPELETAINAAITAVGAAHVPPIPTADMPTVVYDPIINLFSFDAQANNVGGAAGVWAITSPYTYPNSQFGPVPNPNTLGKDILSIMGFLPAPAGGLVDNFVDADPVQGHLVFVAQQAAPLAFTQYIDVCSPQLCKFQNFRDGSTSSLARRSDIICRLYIVNNVAIPSADVDGTRPFVINRQYQNARVMKWTADNAVGQIDINLYDDVGQPLQITWQPRSYQITFLAYESKDRSEGGSSADGLENLLQKYAPYRARNEEAWLSPSFPFKSR